MLDKNDTLWWLYSHVLINLRVCERQFNCLFYLLNLVFETTDVSIAFQWSFFDLHNIEQRVSVILHYSNNGHASVGEENRTIWL